MPSPTRNARNKNSSSNTRKVKKQSAAEIFAASQLRKAAAAESAAANALAKAKKPSSAEKKAAEANKKKAHKMVMKAMAQSGKIGSAAKHEMFVAALNKGK